MATADQVIEGILGKEGGYVNNPSDKGGPIHYALCAMSRGE